MNPTPTTHHDAVCLSCGYSLSGLGANGRCPECDTPIERSIRGIGLAAASPDYVLSLRRGATITWISVLVDVLWFASFPVLLSLAEEKVIPLSVDAALRIVTLLDLVGVTLGLVGWWLLSSPDPSGSRRFELRSRRVLRTMLVLSAAWAIVQCVVQFIPAIGRTEWHVLAGNLQFGPSTVWSTTLIVALSIRTAFMLLRFARFWVGLIYLRALAALIPSPPLHARCTRQIWLIPLLSTLGFVLLGLGPVVAIFMYLRTLWRFRRTLGEIAPAAT